MARPEPQDYAPFAENYVKLVTKDNLLEEMHDSLEEIFDLLESIPAGKEDHAYTEGKWTVREVLQHMIDTERIFSYRAVAIARGEKQGLPGFDENAYAAMVDVSGRNFQEMKEELLILRRSVYLMYKGFTIEALTRAGEASQMRVTVNALGYMIVGHVRHHANILMERYL